MCYRENCQKIGKTPEENIIRPLDTLGFLKYLAVNGVLPDKMLDKPERYLQRINELLARLVFQATSATLGKVARLWLEIVTTRCIKQRVTNDRVFFIWHER